MGGVGGGGMLEDMGLRTGKEYYIIQYMHATQTVMGMAATSSLQQVKYRLLLRLILRCRLLGGQLAHWHCPSSVKLTCRRQQQLRACIMAANSCHIGKGPQ